MSFEIVSSLGRFEQEMLRPHAKIAIAIAFDAFGVMNIGPPSVSRHFECVILARFKPATGVYR